MKSLKFYINNLAGYLLIIGVLSIFTVGCENDDIPQMVTPILPVFSLTTSMATGITTNAAICGGIILSDGGRSILNKGVCWNTSPAPTLADNVIEDVSNSDTIKVNLSGLMIYTTYYIRSYATNSVETVYGEETFFTTQGGTVTDIDGNVYHTISIGSQVWMLENLKVTKYQNGDSISFLTDHLVWQTSPGAYCYYDNDTDYKEVYGALYNWWAVNDSRQLAPEGWHVPRDVEWEILLSAAGSGGNMKEKGMSHWKATNVGATNESGFTGLPGGYRDRLGYYTEIRKGGYFWSSTPYYDLWNNSGAWYNYLRYDTNRAEVWMVLSNYGYSVRCVRDE